MALLIKTDGSVQYVEPMNPKKGFQLKEAQQLVDGYVEVVTLGGTHYIMLCDEEGYCKSKQINVAATAVMKEFYPLDAQYILGDVLICKSKDFK